MQKRHLIVSTQHLKNWNHRYEEKALAGDSANMMEVNMPTTDNNTKNPPCAICGTVKRLRSYDRWNNWLCKRCAEATIVFQEAGN